MNPRSAPACLHGAVLLFGLSGLIGKAVSSPALMLCGAALIIGANFLGLLGTNKKHSR